MNYKNYKNDGNDSDTDSDKNSKAKFDGYDHHIWKFEITNKLQSKGLWKIVHEGKDSYKQQLLMELNSQINDIMNDVNTLNDVSASTDPSTSTNTANTDLSRISSYDKNNIRELKRQITIIDQTIDKIDKKAIMIIDKSLTKKIKNRIITCESSKDVWDTIERYYGFKDQFSIAQLKHKYNSFKMKERGNLSYYITKLNQYRLELQSNGSVITESDHIHKILHGLTNDYSSFVQSFIALSQEITAIELENRLLKLETNKNNMENNGKKGGYAYKSNMTKCSYCHKPGHTKEKCWKLHGRPNEEKNNSEESKTQESPKSKRCMTARKEHNLNFYLDSGATDHICNDPKFLTNFKSSNDNNFIKTSSGERMQILGDGDIDLGKVVLKNVLLVPNADANLISLNKITSKGFSALFLDDSAIIMDTMNENEKVFIFNKNHEGMYFLDFSNRKASVAKQASDAIMHNRFAHYNDNFVNQVVSEKVKTDNCDACMLGKMTKRKINKVTETPKAPNPLHTVSMDIVTFTNYSVRDFKYCLVLVDHYSSYIKIYPMKEKSASSMHIIDYCVFMQSRLKRKISYLKHDNDTVFNTTELNNYLVKSGIMHLPTTEHDKTQLGTVDRKIRDLEDRVRCLLVQCKLPSSFWCYAADYAALIMNNIKSPSSNELLFNQKVNTSRFRVFGCIAYVYVRKEERGKEDPTGCKMIFIGMNDESYIFLNPVTGKTIYSINAKFVETEFYSKRLKYLENMENDDEFTSSDESSISDDDTNNALNDDYEIESEDINSTSSGAANDSRYPQRQRREPIRYSYTAEFEYEPKTYSELKGLKNSEDWFKAVSDEYSSLVNYGTWTPVKRSNQNVVGSRWVFKIKSSGRFKARFVAKGYSQVQGLDFEEVFAGVADFDTIRLFLCISFNKRNYIGQADVHTAFLNGDIDENIYIEPPEGYEKEYKGQVLKLNKAIYGLKQAGRQWCLKFKEIAHKIGFKNIYSDSSIFYKHLNGHDIFILLYVDDILISAHDKKTNDSMIVMLNEYFKVNDLGPASLFIGWKIRISDQQLFLSQESKILEILNQYEMIDAKESSVPMQANLNLSKSDSKENMNFPYRNLIGVLNYIARGTRPDIMYAVYYLARFQSCYNQEHITALKQILRYLKSTYNYGLVYKKQEKADYILKGYCDSDYGTDENDRKSVSGYCFFVNDCLISWNSKKQSTVAKSTVEAEYQALPVAISEGIWLRNILQELGHAQKGATIIFEDNQGCINLVKNPIVKSRVKHLDIKTHFIRDRVQMNDIQLVYISTEDQIADIFTKSLTKRAFQNLRSSLNVGMGGSVVNHDLTVLDNDSVVGKDTDI